MVSGREETRWRCVWVFSELSARSSLNESSSPLFPLRHYKTDEMDEAYDRTINKIARLDWLPTMDAFRTVTLQVQGLAAR